MTKTPTLTACSEINYGESATKPLCRLSPSVSTPTIPPATGSPTLPPTAPIDPVLLMDAVVVATQQLPEEERV